MTARQRLAFPVRDGTEGSAAPVTPLADDSLAILVISLAGRLNRGATGYYQRHFGIGMAEFRIVMALGRTEGANVGEVAAIADVDQAVASRSLRMLAERGLVEVEQTQSRGRAAIVGLTAAGEAFERDLRDAAQHREKCLAAALDAGQLAATTVALRKLIDQVPHMNKENQQ